MDLSVYNQARQPRHPIWTGLAEELAETHARRWWTAEPIFLSTLQDTEMVRLTGTCVDLARRTDQHYSPSSTRGLIQLLFSVRQTSFRAPQSFSKTKA
jgi:hypothetical protein